MFQEASKYKGFWLLYYSMLFFYHKGIEKNRFLSLSLPPLDITGILAYLTISLIKDNLYYTLYYGVEE